MEHCSKVGNPLKRRTEKGGETENRTTVVRQRWFYVVAEVILTLHGEGGTDLSKLKPTSAFIRFPRRKKCKKSKN